MKYSTTIELDAASGSVNSWLFRCNSIHDPDYSSTGHQPSLHDLYAGLYSHYEVLSSKIVARPLPVPETTSSQAGQHVCQLSITNVDSATEANLPFDSIREMKRGPIMFVNDNTLTYGKSSSIYKAWSHKSWFGRYSPQDTGSDFGSNPAVMAYFKIQQSAPQTGFNPVPLMVIIDIYYTVRLTRPITQAQS